MADFILDTWCAWSPALDIRDDRLVETIEISAASSASKSLHRRLSPLAKAVFRVAESCLEQTKTLPVVFSSAHGEICKSLEMLKTIQAGDEISPTAFSLSVHNAIAGLFSIAFNNSAEITVIAPCQEGIAAAFIEALGLLQEGADEALILFYDEPIADFYPTAPYNLNTDYPCAAGLKISSKGKGTRFTLSQSANTRDDGEQPLQLLALIRFLLSGRHTLELGNQGHSWIWQKT